MTKCLESTEYLSEIYIFHYSVDYTNIHDDFANIWFCVEVDLH